MVRKEAPPRVKTAHKAYRGRGGAGGRGRGRGRGARQQTILEGNEWTFDQEEGGENIELMKATLDACTRQLPDPPSSYNETTYSKEQIEEMSKILSTLTIDEQINAEFLVPVESIETQISTDIVETPLKPEPKPEPPKQEKPKDLNAWLDGLLG